MKAAWRSETRKCPLCDQCVSTFPEWETPAYRQAYRLGWIIGHAFCEHAVKRCFGFVRLVRVEYGGARRAP